MLSMMRLWHRPLRRSARGGIVVPLIFLSLIYVILLIQTATTSSYIASSSADFTTTAIIGSSPFNWVKQQQRDKSRQKRQKQQQHGSTTTVRNRKVMKDSISTDHVNKNDHNRNNTTTEAKFVFIIGIEGTGHNLMKELYKDSPSMKFISNKLGLFKDIDALHIALHQPKGGLLNLHCGLNTKGIDSKTGLADVAGKFNKVVTRLKHISKVVAESSSSSIDSDANIQEQPPPSFVSIPLNVITHEMASYPQDSDNCRPLKYPNIDLLYRACDEAKVSCEHILLYRDPYAVLKSITKNRGFESSGIKAIHLYVTMLKIIYAQLLTYSSKSIGCFGFYDDDDVTSSEYWNPIRDLFGWSGDFTMHAKFNKYIKSKYKPPPKLTDVEREAIVPSKYEIHMQSFIQANDNVIRLCHQQLAENNIINNK